MAVLGGQEDENDNEEEKRPPLSSVSDRLIGDSRSGTFAAGCPMMIAESRGAWARRDEIGGRDIVWKAGDPMPSRLGSAVSSDRQEEETGCAAWCCRSGGSGCDSTLGGAEERRCDEERQIENGTNAEDEEVDNETTPEHDDLSTSVMSNAESDEAGCCRAGENAVLTVSGLCDMAATETLEESSKLLLQ